MSCRRLKSVALRDFDRFQVQTATVTLNLSAMRDVLKGVLEIATWADVDVGVFLAALQYKSEIGCPRTGIVCLRP